MPTPEQEQEILNVLRTYEFSFIEFFRQSFYFIIAVKDGNVLVIRYLPNSNVEICTTLVGGQTPAQFLYANNGPLSSENIISALQNVLQAGRF